MSENLQQLLDQKDRDLELAARKNRLKALNNLIFILNRTFLTSLPHANAVTINRLFSSNKFRL